MEACRIGMHLRAPGVIDVGAPMQHKELCYEMLRDAKVVADRSLTTFGNVSQWAIVMDMTGRVDVAAPVPADYPLWIEEARKVIERYNDDAAPALRPFNDAVMGA